MKKVSIIFTICILIVLCSCSNETILKKKVAKSFDRYISEQAPEDNGYSIDYITFDTIPPTAFFKEKGQEYLEGPYADSFQKKTLENAIINIDVSNSDKRYVANIHVSFKEDWRESENYKMPIINGKCHWWSTDYRCFTDYPLLSEEEETIYETIKMIIVNYRIDKIKDKYNLTDAEYLGYVMKGRITSPDFFDCFIHNNLKLMYEI